MQDAMTERNRRTWKFSRAPAYNKWQEILEILIKNEKQSTYIVHEELSNI